MDNNESDWEVNVFSLFRQTNHNGQIGARISFYCCCGKSMSGLQSLACFSYGCLCVYVCVCVCDGDVTGPMHPFTDKQTTSKPSPPWQTQRGV